MTLCLEAKARFPRAAPCGSTNTSAASIRRACKATAAGQGHACCSQKTFRSWCPALVLLSHPTILLLTGIFCASSTRVPSRAEQALTCSASFNLSTQCNPKHILYSILACSVRFSLSTYDSSKVGWAVPHSCLWRVCIASADVKMLRPAAQTRHIGAAYKGRQVVASGVRQSRHSRHRQVHLVSLDLHHLAIKELKAWVPWPVPSQKSRATCC